MSQAAEPPELDLQVPITFSVRRSAAQFVDLLDQTEHISALQAETGAAVDDSIMFMGWSAHCRTTLKNLHTHVDKLDAIVAKEGANREVDAARRAAIGSIKTQRSTITQFLQKCGSLGEEYRTATVHFLNPMGDHRAAAAIFIEARWRGYLGRKYMDRIMVRNVLIGCVGGLALNVISDWQLAIPMAMH